MDMLKIPTGENPPFDVNAIIEVPLGGEPIKYELDKESGAMFVDRLLYTSMRYPCNWRLYTSPSPRDATLSRMPSSA